jgi:glutamate synthase domain-containing protein 2
MRWIYYFIMVAGSIMVAGIYPYWPSIINLLFFLIPYGVIGFFDIRCKKKTILRNYPVVGHIRYILEYFRPEIQQYFVETDSNGTPYSREIRSYIYQQAKNVRDTIPFGTKNNITEIGYQFSYHSLSPKNILPEVGRVLFGGPDCKKPYSASLLNVSAMSFGALSPNALRALNKGAKKGGFAHNTGEGGISPYHLEGGGDLIWQIGTGYFGCRKKDGRFDPVEFEKRANLDVIKMIELKLSQGAKPSHGGILPAAKVTEEIAKIRLLETGKDAISPAMHPEFSTPIGLLEFLQKLRNLSGGKPTGFKLCIGKKSEFLAICKAMIKTGILPDFITIDGAEGGTGAAPVIFTNRLGTPVDEALNFVHNSLVGVNLRDKIKIIASGKIATSYDMFTKIALGADTCNAARAMMFALGCIQSLGCNTNKCPTGIATQNKHRWKSLDVRDKYIRVANFHKNTIHSFIELLGATGKSGPSELTAADIRRYTDISNSKSLDQLYPQLIPGDLLSTQIHDEFKDHWQEASAEKF